MSALPLLIEIGTEEIPDWMIRNAVSNFREMVTSLLAEEQLGGVIRFADATPRRIALIADQVLSKQPDREELVFGPPKSAAFQDGKPTSAALGFARKNGVEVDMLRIEATPKGEYVAVRKMTPGRSAKQILAQALPDLILKIYFPKTMYWTGKGGARFIRPIRWLVAVLGENEVIPFEIEGVASSNITDGHRRLGARAIFVHAGNYVSQLEANGVIVCSEQRKRRILDGMAKLVEGTGLRVKADSALLETLVFLTEYPTPILGSFDRHYLALPEEVLVTVMRHHQKYFSLEDEAGRLAPNFIAVINMASDPEGIVRHGNERVLQARFNDARFFWEFDQRKRLEDRVPDLAHVTFQAKLGSYLDKTHRMVALVREFGGDAHAVRAALLSKCDLTTEMVKEFTELQGIMGGLYARQQGEPEEVARAIYDHYKPLSMEDSIPATLGGCLVALADKVDTLRGCFELGLAPTGSKDPFALRRAAQGVVKILVEGKIALSLDRLAAGNHELRDFLLDRVRYYFKDVRGFRYDEVNAVLASAADDLVDVEQRLLAIQTVRPTADFEPLAASFKRIQNILRQAGFTGCGAVDASLLEPGPEQELFAAFEKLRLQVSALREKKDYEPALVAIASLRPQVDRFFDHVLVNVSNETVRQNRLTLLANLLTEFSSIADFSEIVTSS
ncbi:MAG: glycine--tRNA ligase subunit beta [Bryobacteraceae bacterium]|nr:glycine--tRNA ligase subunit beta [Bryobacteraceae bacterium]MDW8378796.1 glycine--tRNA ligase subunit beta [Bryobacterales bacterium]